MMLVRQQLHELVSLKNINFIIAWIPGHCNIPEHDHADNLAKNALSDREIDIIIRPTSTDHIHKINNYSLNK